MKLVKRKEIKNGKKLLCNLTEGWRSRGQVLPIKDMDDRGNYENRENPVKDFIAISLTPEDPGKITYVGEKLHSSLLDIGDMPTIDPELITHKL